MKSILLASALMISGVAFAQADPRDAGQPIGSNATLQPGTTMGERDTMGPPPATNPPATTTTMPDSTMSSTMSTGTTTSTMGTSGSGTVMVQQGGNMTAPPASTGPYPRCSRTITDHCKQDESRARDVKHSRR
ncbi:hypothetical protein GON01_04680 [Sphingomonas sp. MAH-20]|uniref:Fe-S oxidoreductase n=1 Tax=Sphingomonas horti TaxID=2682842 RepID=A0A6I4IYK8_9SPHN|nr:MULTISPECIES: hypothetical protein [Sphingomonas]MBA2918268.1 hypothetical protein [Sphingomonas sp. CGMCC 1.13658]MVO77235.1 hypothetical protein [Sphingomonas horti]